MDFINLGNTGLKVSRICLGCMTYGSPATGKLLPGRQPWALNEAESRPFLQQALDLGINFFDTANVYSDGDSEIVLGRFLKASVRRESVVIATKVCSPMREEPNGRGLSRKAIVFELEQSLKRLETDYVDLYQIHRWDYETPIEETLEALHDMVKAGKVRYFGASSMYSWQFAKSLYISQIRGWMRFVSMQNHYNLLYREEEREMMGLCRAENIAVLPWSPLARGLLAGTRTREGERLTTRARTDQFGDALYNPRVDFEVVDRCAEVASARGVPSAQIALAWLLAKPGVTAPIVGATKLEHLEDALAAERLTLDDDEIERLQEPYVPHAISGH